MWWHFTTSGLLRVVGPSLIGSIVINRPFNSPWNMTLQVSQILFDVHIPVSLKVFSRRDFLLKSMKWYQICPSRLSYYFVINEVESCTISFLGILQIDDLLQWQEVEDTAPVGEREVRSPVQCPASFVNPPGMKPPLHFSLGCLSST